MKLASSWLEDAPTPTPLETFHDEVEEVDEIDESKDGCGGVAWQNYVLKKPHTSNKMLHELAREIRGVEQKRGRRLRAPQYKTILHNWQSASQRFLRPNHDYLTEFLAKLDRVTVPKGETLQAAFERAKHRQPPPKVLMIPNDGVRLLASLCRELQEMAGDQPFMLCQTSVAKLFGHSSHRNISNWIMALKTLEVLKRAEPAAHAAFTAARAETEKLVRAQPGNEQSLSVLALIDAELGEKEKAIQEGRIACNMRPVARDAVDGAILITNLARIYALTGEKDLALKQLEIVSKIPCGPSYGELRLDLEWDALRGDPRFEKIVASLAPKEN